MSSRRSLKKRLSALEAEAMAEDGRCGRLRLWTQPTAVRASRTDDRKARQLCRQIERTLHSVLAESRDDVLRDLMVESVEPAPNTSRLLVTVTSLETDARTEIVLAHLDRATPRLRAEIATAIQRKRLPELAYRVGVSKAATSNAPPETQGFRQTSRSQ